MKDTFIADEFGIVFQQNPTKALHLKGKCGTGDKHSQVRLAGLAAGTAAGEKLPVFIIGKSETPRY